MSRLDLGVGLALMPGLTEAIEDVADLVDCLEVEPQTFWWETGDPVEPFRIEGGGLASLTKRFDAVLAHGVTSPVGGSRLPDSFVAGLFADTVELLGAAAFSSAFFLPPRQTPAGIRAAVEAIAALRAGLRVPFSIETPASYLRPRADEIDDGAFVASVADGADCGIVLDLHNIWANQRNGRQDARAYVAQLPLERVWEVHLAGGLDPAVLLARRPLRRMLALTAEGVAATVGLAHCLGVTDEMLLDVLDGSPLLSPWAAAKLRRMSNDDYSAEFALALALKDVDLALDTLDSERFIVLRSLAQEWHQATAAGPGGDARQPMPTVVPAHPGVGTEV